jgi:hypothetical protein
MESLTNTNQELIQLLNTIYPSFRLIYHNDPSTFSNTHKISIFGNNGNELLDEQLQLDLETKKWWCHIQQVYQNFSTVVSDLLYWNEWTHEEHIEALSMLENPNRVWMVPCLSTKLLKRGSNVFLDLEIVESYELFILLKNHDNGKAYLCPIEVLYHETPKTGTARFLIDGSSWIEFLCTDPLTTILKTKEMDRLLEFFRPAFMSKRDAIEQQNLFECLNCLDNHGPSEVSVMKPDYTFIYFLGMVLRKCFIDRHLFQKYNWGWLEQKLHCFNNIGFTDMDNVIVTNNFGDSFGFEDYMNTSQLCYLWSFDQYDCSRDQSDIESLDLSDNSFG